MVRTRIRKILRDVWARKARTALVSISILIGVFGVVTLIGSGDIIIRQLQADIRADELPMGRVFLQVGPESTADENFDPAVLETLRNPQTIPGYEELATPTRVEARFFREIQWHMPGDDAFIDDFVLASSEPFDGIQLEPFRLLDEGDGRWPVDGANEVVIERRVADKYELAVGDTLIFRILAEANREVDAEGRAVIPEEEWEIVGIVFHPYQPFSTGGQQIQSNRLFYTTLDNARRLSGGNSYTSFQSRFEDYATYEANDELYESLVVNETPYSAFFNFSEDPEESQVITNSQQFILVLNILALVALTVAGFLVMNVINTIVAEQRKQIGVMKSLGATRQDSIFMYGGIALVYGVIGLVPGVLLGLPAAAEIARVLGTFAGAYIEGFQISWLAVGIGIGMGLLVPLLASIIPVYNGTRVTILEAMTDLGISGAYGHGPFARGIAALPFPINVKQALANISLKKVRLGLTVITMTLAVAAFMGVSALFISISDTVTGLFDTFQFEIQYIPQESLDYDATEQLLLETFPDDIEAIYPGSFIAVRMDDYVDEQFGFDQVFVLGYDPADSAIVPEITDGREFTDDITANEIVVTQVLSDALDKGVGDTVEVRGAGKVEEFTIVGIDGLIPFGQAYMHWQRLSLFGDIVTGSEVEDTFLTLSELRGYESGLPGAGETFIVALSAGTWDQVVNFPQLGIENPTDPNLVLVSEGLAASLEQPVSIQTAAIRADYNIGAELPALALQSVLGPAYETLPEGARGEDAQILYLPYTAYAALEGREVQNGGTPAANVMLIDMYGDDLSVQAVDSTMTDVKELLLANGLPGTYENQVQTSEDIATGVLSLGVLFNATSLVMALVGAIGLLTMLFMAVYERQKEIGVMRSVGATSATIVTQFLVEGVLVGMIAFLLAVPLSVLLANGLASVLPFGDVFQFSYPLWIIGVGFVGTLVIAAVASVWPSLSAANRTVSDILRYQ
jgi:putative ABC transport system permease protein